LPKRRPAFNSTLASVLALVVVIPVFVVASASVVRLIADGYRVETEIRRAQVLASTLLVLQLDEESAVRGFINTGRQDFLEPYYVSVPEFADVGARLDSDLERLGVPGAIAALHEMIALNQEWQVRIAISIVHQAHPKPNVAKALLGKEIVDEERVDDKQIADALSQREALGEQETSKGFVRATLLAVLATLAIGGSILAFGISRTRFEAELERERTLVEKLQRAFIHRWDPLPGAGLGTAYLSATQNALVGGDLFDVRRIGPRRGYVLIADVSGKGIEAAVDTAFIKFSIRALAHDDDDPGVILTAFNQLVLGSLSHPDAFVVAFLGFFDAAHGTLRYSSAGHSAAFLRRGNGVTQLSVTGPILGVSENDLYVAQTVDLQPGDLIVLATDGLTEARNGQRTMLGDDGAMEWIAELKATEAQAAADELVARLKRFVASNRLDDDLALVAVRVQAGPT
jgi:serine phosphatase RsbU (regulator of sigma subunit)